MRFHSEPQLVGGRVLQAGVDPERVVDHRRRNVARVRETRPMPRHHVATTNARTRSRSSTRRSARPTTRRCCWYGLHGPADVVGRRRSASCSPTRGRYVIRFDNRDCGLSTQLDGVSASTPMAVMQAALAGEPSCRRCRTRCPTWPTTPSACSTHLGIERAHVVGASMGGMIAQTMAIEHPERCLQPDVDHELARRPASRPADAGGAGGRCSTPPPTEREAFIDAPARRDRVVVEAVLRRRARRRQRAGDGFDRAFYPEGAPRQLAAIYASGDRTERAARASTCRRSSSTAATTR